jgi:hypothetical protein
MARLTAKARANIPSKEFAVPSKDGYPIDTRKRAATALGLVGMHGSPAEKAQVRSAVARKYPQVEQSRGPQAKKPAARSGSGGGNGRAATRRAARTLTGRLDQRDRARRE